MDGKISNAFFAAAIIITMGAGQIGSAAPNKSRAGTTARAQANIA